MVVMTKIMTENSSTISTVYMCRQFVSHTVLGFVGNSPGFITLSTIRKFQFCVRSGFHLGFAYGSLERMIFDWTDSETTAVGVSPSEHDSRKIRSQPRTIELDGKHSPLAGTDSNFRNRSTQMVKHRLCTCTISKYDCHDMAILP